MIFILNQSVLNGTVTISTTPLGIEAESFESAKEIVKNLKGNERFFNINENDKQISFNIKQDDSMLSVFAIMYNKELEIKQK